MSVLVALIDSGVHCDHSHLRGWGRVVPGPSLVSPNRPRDSLVDHLGHGTALAAAMAELAPTLTLLSIKVFDTAPRCPFEFILQAIEIACDAGAEIINLSLGSAELRWVAPLEELVARARDEGRKIVAPASFHGLPSWPGALAGVEGVVGEPSLRRSEPPRRGSDGLWRACPYPRSLPGLDRHRNLNGSSFACANLSAWFAAGFNSPATEDPGRPEDPG